MLKQTLMIGSMLIAGISLSGCTWDQQSPIVTQINIPTTLLDCDQKHVKLPDPTNMTNVQLLQYITQVNNLLAECQTDVASIRQWEIAVNKEITTRKLSLPSIKVSLKKK